MRLRSFLPYYVVITLVLSVVFILFFGKIFLDPNGYLFSGDHDGLKNYYTAAYYVHYDEGFHFSGMNYPYGTHVVYTDNQPVISFIIKALGLKDYIVGILNWLMFLSYYLCAFFLFRIFLKTRVNRWYAVIVSILITLLSPQLIRITGHYALSYAAFVPMVWLFIINYYERGCYKQISYLFLTILIFGFIHPYFLPLGFLLCASFFVVGRLQKRINNRAALAGLAVAILPMVIFRVFLLITDSVSDRAESVYGPLNYRASFESVFLPVTGPFLDVWNFFISVRPAKFEGYSFVGTAGLLILIFSVMKIWNYGRDRRFRLILRPALPVFLSISIWASFLVLFFSMAIPLKWNLEFLLDIVTPLKQFRSIGRFGWVFYYVFTFYVAYYVYLLFRYFNRRNSSIAISITSLFILAFLIDGYANIKFVSDVANVHVTESPFRNARTRNSEFQAAIALPFFIIGTEKIDVNGNPSIRKHSVEFSFTEGLPLVNSMLSRLSRSEAENLFQLFNSPLLPYTGIKNLVPDKPLLLIIDRKAKLKKGEAALVAKAEYLSGDPEFDYYKLWPDTLKSKALTQEVGDSYVEPLLYVHFDEIDEEISFSGKGAFLVNKDINGGDIIFDGEISGAIPDSVYELSYWLYQDPYMPGNPSVMFQALNAAGEVVEEKRLHYETLDFDVYNGWIRIGYDFKWNKEYSTIRVRAVDKQIVLDELLLRPENYNIIYWHGSIVSINNYPVDLKQGLEQ